MEDLVESILDYIRSDYTDYAIMINGEWGSGKTYFWNNQIKKKIDTMKLNGKRYTTICIPVWDIPYSFGPDSSVEPCQCEPLGFPSPSWPVSGFL